VDHRKSGKFRLDRLLSQALGLSRRQAQIAIRAGEVRVNGAVVTETGAPTGPEDRVDWLGREVGRTAARYFMLNKPVGVVCASRDREHRTVLDLLDLRNKDGLHVAGRLDMDATGLVLITDDGEWSHRISAPRFKLPKTYRVKLAEPLTPEAARSLETGIQLRGEPKRCAPACIEPHGGTEVRITITEGKYHQVKRMFAAVGNRVIGLKRECIGSLVLDPALAEGESRPLMPEEVLAVVSR